MEVVKIKVRDFTQVSESKLVLSFAFPVLTVSSISPVEYVFTLTSVSGWAPTFARAPSPSGFIGGLNWQFA